MSENRRYTVPDSYTFEVDDRPNHRDSSQDFAPNTHETRAFDPLKKRLASMDSKDRLHYLTE